MTDADKKLYDKAVEALDQMGAGLPSEIEKYVPAWIDGYEKGLKAKINVTTISDCPIKAEWHKVADGDLPKDEGFVCNQDGLPCWFDIKNDQWLDCEGTQIRTTEWCEIPQYKVE